MIIMLIWGERHSSLSISTYVGEGPGGEEGEMGEYMLSVGG